MPTHEASTREDTKREPLALVSDGGGPARADVDEHVRGRSLLRASLGTRLGVVAVAVGVLWLAVLWALL